ncbi:MAG: GAF domain-containing protein, partial [Magnetococcales bacterium]|nr:GAF domain-containing protein [Magnetococcales bacterium]
QPTRSTGRPAAERATAAVAAAAQPGGDITVLAMERENRRLKFSRDMTREFVRSSGSMKKVMEVIFSRVVDVLEAEAGSLWLYDPRSDQNICHLAEGPAKKQIVGLRLPKGKGIVGQVIDSNAPDVVLDCSHDPRFASTVDQRSGFTTQSMLCVPLSDGPEAFGAIQIINKRSGFEKQFTEDDRMLVEDLSLSASIAVRNARLMETESRVKEMNILMEISRQVSASLDLDSVLGMVVNMAGDLVETSGVAIALLNEEKNTLFLAMLSGGRKVKEDSPEHQELVKLMEAVRSGERITYIPNVAESRKKSGEAENPWADYLEKNGLVSLWGTALKDEEGILGVLWLEGTVADFARGNKSDTLVILASQVSVSLRNASLFRRIPFADVLGKVGKKGQSWMSGWRRTVLIGCAVVGLGAILHFVPWFRVVTGNAVVEARFGRGVYLPVAGRVDETFVQEGDMVKQGDRLLQLDDTPIRLRMVQAESKLGLLERQIVEAKAAADMAALSKATIERIAAQAELVQARDELGKVTLRAPGDGLVLTARPQELIGRDFALGDEVLRLADPSRFTVVVEVPETDVLDVVPGLTVRGVLRSRPGKGFRGAVIHVGRAFAVPAEALEEGVVDPEPPEGFVAEVRVDDSDVPLRPGMTGQAAISTPGLSPLVRIWRRVVNATTFWLGL